MGAGRWLSGGHLQTLHQLPAQGTVRLAIDRMLPHADLLAGPTPQRDAKTNGIRCSRSRKGECLDNAVAKGFFGRLKDERTAHRTQAMRQDVQRTIVSLVC
jgi:transposase InsO family protein